MANQLDEQLERLLLNKPYHQLTEQEQAFVLRQVDASVYQSMRQSLLTARTIFQECPSPKKEVKKQLHAALAKRRANHFNRFFTELLAYRLPVWQVAMSFGMVLIYFMFPWAKPDTPQANSPMIVYKTDTIFSLEPQPTKTADSNAIETDTQSVTGIRAFKENFADTMSQIAQHLQTVLPDPKERWSISNVQYASNDSAMFRPSNWSAYSDKAPVYYRRQLY